MTNYREILRLRSLGLNNTQIAALYSCSRTTVIRVLQQASVQGITHGTVELLSDKDLEARIKPPVVPKVSFEMPDYDYINMEMQRSGMTLNLLWLEHCWNHLNLYLGGFTQPAIPISARVK